MRIKNTTIEATPNYSERTFTLREKDENGKTISKYRTLPMGKDEFDDEEYNTSSDWANFLKSGGYYTVR